MIEIFKALLLGSVQGISEFLPISSTGHLIILENYLGISQKTFGLAFDASLHLGTFFAVLLFFWQDWKKIIPSFINTLKKRKVETFEEKLSWMVLLGTIPAALLGVVLNDIVENAFRSTSLVAWVLILGSLIFVAAEFFGKRKNNLESLGFIGAIFVGAGQAIALIPGVSRSGITISFGMFANLTRQEAARFAFLLSAPIILGAGGKQFLSVSVNFLEGKVNFSEFQFFILGIISATFFGFLTVKYFLKFLSVGNLYPFILYRLILGIILLALQR